MNICIYGLILSGTKIENDFFYFRIVKNELTYRQNHRDKTSLHILAFDYHCKIPYKLRHSKIQPIMIQKTSNENLALFLGPQSIYSKVKVDI